MDEQSGESEEKAKLDAFLSHSQRYVRSNFKVGPKKVFLPPGRVGK